MSIHALNSHLKCSFESILEKNQQNFSLQGPSFVCHTKTFIEAPLFQETSPAQKNSWLSA